MSAMTCGDQRVKSQIGVVNYFEIFHNVVFKFFIKFDDPEAGRKLIGANRLAWQK